MVLHCLWLFFMNLSVVVVTTLCFGWGIYLATKKQYAEHKDWMLLGLIVILGTGVVRFFQYIMQPFFGDHCSAMASDWPLFASFFLGVFLALGSFYRAGRLSALTERTASARAKRCVVGYLAFAMVACFYFSIEWTIYEYEACATPPVNSSLTY